MITSTIIIFYLVKNLLSSILNLSSESEGQEMHCVTCSTSEAREKQGEPDTDSEKTTIGNGIQTQFTDNLLALDVSRNSSMIDQYEMERLSVSNPDVSKEFLQQLESHRTYLPQSTLTWTNEDVNCQKVLNSLHKETDYLLWDCNEQESSQTSSDRDGYNKGLDDKSQTRKNGGEPVSQYSVHNRSYQDMLSEKDCLNYLETLLYSDMKEEMVEALYTAFDQSNNPLSLVLYIIKFAAFDYCSNKKSLAYITLTEFEKWLGLKREGLSEVEQQSLGLVATDELKDLALEVVVTSKLMMFEPIKRIYQLDCANNGFLEKHVRFLLFSKHKYKEAAVLATKLHLQTHFEHKEILLPLLIQDKVQLAESYVAECPWQQKALLSMLDKLCNVSDEELENIARSTLSLSLIPKHHKFTHKALIKLAERLVKMFNLDPEDYPNVFKGKNLDGLFYLLRKKYTEKGPSVKWDNLIETSIGCNKWLQLKLVECIADLGDVDEAARWSRHYGLSVPSLPANVQEVLAQEIKSDNPLEDWEAELEGRSEPRQPDQTPHEQQIQLFHQLALPWNRIKLVEDAASLQHCLSRVCKPGAVVGFDSEWRPTMCRAGTSNKLAIIQLATYTEVFILDMIALFENVTNNQLEEFGERLFSSSDCLKLGYGLESDMQVLDSSCPLLKPALRKIKRFVDLCPLSKEVMSLPSVKQKLKYTQSSKLMPAVQFEKGLSELVFHCLGRPLDKNYQVSDWERRPLLPEQLMYAALDAYCLLEVYDVLKAWVQESKMHVNMEPELPAWKWLFPERKRSSSHRRRRNKHEVQADILPPAVKTHSPITPGSLAIVVDTMLQGLGRQLRCCGVDVVIPENDASTRKIVEVAKHENRWLLTCGIRRYNILRPMVSNGVCVCIPHGSVREQVAAILKYFNVKVTNSDLFSRCQVCNGEKYTKISSHQMYVAFQVAHGLVNPSNIHETRESPINYSNLTINQGIPLQVNVVPEEVLNKNQVFLCCSTCGKVFWEGSHFKTVKTQFSYVVDQSATDETVYTS